MARRLIWAVPTLLIVTFLVYVAIRIGTDPVPATSVQRAGEPGEGPGVHRHQRAVRGLRRVHQGLLPVARRVPHRRLAEQHQGQPRSVAEPQGRDGELLRLAGIGACLGILIGITFGVFMPLKPGSFRDGGINTAPS